MSKQHSPYNESLCDKHIKSEILVWKMYLKNKYFNLLKKLVLDILHATFSIKCNKMDYT